MMIKYIILGFLILESANVLTLYFFPDSKLANGMGVFKAWEKSKKDDQVHDLVKYLVNWVAGTKLIFILLLIVILVTADDKTLVYSAAALAASISSFFWRLFPLIRKMDQMEQIEPKGYSLVLGGLIAVFILVFIIAILMTI